MSEIQFRSHKFTHFMQNKSWNDLICPRTKLGNVKDLWRFKVQFRQHKCCTDHLKVILESNKKKQKSHRLVICQWYSVRIISLIGLNFANCILNIQINNNSINGWTWWIDKIDCRMWLLSFNGICKKRKNTRLKKNCFQPEVYWGDVEKKVSSKLNRFC